MPFYFELTTIYEDKGGRLVSTEPFKTVEEGSFALGRIAAGRTWVGSRFHVVSGFPRHWDDALAVTVYPEGGDSVMDAVAALRRVEGPFPG